MRSHCFRCQRYRDFHNGLPAVLVGFRKYKYVFVLLLQPPPPIRVDTHIQQSNETLSIYIHVERVYLRPECSIVIGIRSK